MMPSPTGVPVQTPEMEPPQRILFVEDDRKLSAFLCRLPAAASPSQDGAARQIGFDGWLLDLDARVLRDARGRAQSLTTQEFNLLSVLAQRPGRVLSRDQLLDLTVSRNWAPYDRSVDVMIGTTAPLVLKLVRRWLVRCRCPTPG
ncbi:winged helix-turn-helix domain-containing protein [Paracoccus sp. N5]|uniref:winged helix-turn-helix domain-containing protein n=1 Tax=Paracoccus sp. N5 TaxID=1101189 RepID=UPI0003693FCB|nr:winged helix-turn-helix domain-containing protein [Paracoccus sp. N5]